MLTLSTRQPMRTLQLVSLAWKADDEFGGPRTIANFDHPRILIIPKTEIVLPFLNERLGVDTGLPGAIQHFSFFV